MINKIFYGWWIVLACFFISLYIGSAVFFGLTAFFKPLIKEFGWSYTQVSFAASLRGLEMGIAAPLVGFLVDRYGSRKIMFLGVLISGAGLLLLSQTQTLATFYGAYIILGFGSGGCTSTVSMVVVAKWFKKDIGKAIGLMASGFGASGLLIPFIVQLIDYYNWRIALIILGVGMWIIGISMSQIIRNDPEECGMYPDGLPPTPPFDPSSSEETDESVDFKEILKNRSFWYLGLVECLRMFSGSAVILHIMPYLSNAGLPRSAAGWVAGAIPLMSIFGRTGFGWLGDLFEKRFVMMLACTLMAMGLFFFCFAQSWFLIVLFLLFFSTGFGGSMVLRGTILREYFGTHALGKMLGIVMGLASVGGIIGPTVAGRAYDTMGSYQWVWPVFVVVQMVAVGLSLKIKSVATPVPKENPEPC